LPHIVVEYSRNLEKSVDIVELLKCVHDTAIATKAFPLEALRTRAAPREQYLIADGNPRNAFLAIVGRIAPGRPAQLRHELGRILFEAVQGYLSEVSRRIPLSITVELHEIDQTSAFRHNSIVP
jgi:5-carboxymethyl-2-hydroxymuconate isomerase